MKLTIGILAMLCASISPADAADFEMRMFGHKVDIIGEMPDMQMKIDDRKILDDAIVMIDEVAIVSDVPVMIGTSSGGGNACEGSRFVISFPAAAMPRLDGPLDNCAGVGVENKGSNLLFAAEAIPGRDGDRWLWTPADGFKKIDSVTFQPDSGKGWADLPTTGKLHPSALLSYSEIARQIFALLGPDKAQYERSITGVGDGEFDGAAYVGSACTPHMCTDEEALLAVDAATKKVYLAWKPSNEKIVVRPPVKEWPPKAKAALKDWAAKWK